MNKNNPSPPGHDRDTSTSGVLHGFCLLREERIEEIQTWARVYRHVQSGAQLVSMENTDENKVFGIGFRTPPTDSTGVAHILEHAVLCGSRRYPLKDPFAQLIKGSLHTFLNALTYPDRTIYPVASTHTQDFYNLIDVYADAVFHPLLTHQHFDQEGWHYEIEDDRLAYRGIVYNEMKGVYSSPESMLGRYSQQNLFPSNTYHHDSGGDPREIPQLTYDRFRQFHSTHYHPSNALIFCYGDDDPRARLAKMDAVLAAFDAQPAEISISPEASFITPSRTTHPYAASDLSQKSMIQISWALPVVDDIALLFGLELLADVLIGSLAAPLRKALVESKLGEDTTSCGLGTGLRQLTFEVGLKGVSGSDIPQVEKLILDTLTDLTTRPFDAELVESALNTAEFHLRENNTGSYPRGVNLMMQIVPAWLYGQDLFKSLAYEAPLAALKERVQQPTYLTTLIRTYLLDNPHRTTTILEPDLGLHTRLEQQERTQLDSVYAQMTPVEIQTVRQRARELHIAQQTPDSPLDVALLPGLQLADLPKENTIIPIEITESDHQSTIIYHDLPTSGIIYLDLGFDLRSLPLDLLPYVPLFAGALFELGTETQDYVEVSTRMGRHTGGIHVSPLISPRMSPREDDLSVAAWFCVRSKATTTKAPELLAILKDVLLTVKLDNRDRLRQMVTKIKSRNEASLVPAGHKVVDGRIRAGLHLSDWVGEQISGVEYLFFLRDLEKKIETDWPTVLATLERVRSHIINRQGMWTHVTADTEQWRSFASQLHAFLSYLPQRYRGDQPSWSPALDTKSEGLIVPTEVNYVGKGSALYTLGYQYHGSIHVIMNYLNTTLLWEKVRMQGGAYGAFASFSKLSGVLTFLSYRDPHVSSTLAAFDETAHLVQHLELTPADLTRNIIGVISQIDAYQLPDAKAYSSLVRYLLGVTEEARQLTRDQILGTTVADFHTFAETLAQVRDHGCVVVMGSSAVLTATAKSHPGGLKLQKIL